ncbi:T family of potassium channels 7-like [Brachionus plicatilis]|uniref:T family of potassium channels 7-like n=1 Tax=Brachionus plicatilis TaxID=10195 RepID=A0A3M7SXY9_BRAPC|nr:T family of potassium channels 7-like [Brachionus plicatilis]
MGKAKNFKWKPYDAQSETTSLYSYSQSSKCCTKENFFKFCRKFITFMISRVGLMIVMIGYVLAGGLIFEAIESDFENNALEYSESILEEMLRRIYKQIENNSTRVKDESFYMFLRHEIRSFGDFFTNATLNGTLTGSIEPQWDFFGSVFYCVTLVSTIGYGHISCKTKWGKIFTILYSSIGIPLMMLFLANTGSSTATLFKFIFRKINSIKRGYRTRKLNRLNRAAWKTFELNGTDTVPEDDELEAYDQNEDFYDHKVNAEAVSRPASEKKPPEQQAEQKTFKKVKKKPKRSVVSVNIGLRYVDIPVEFIKTLVKSASAPKPINVHQGESVAQKTQDPKIVEAMKKIDSLIERESSVDQESDNENEKPTYSLDNITLPKMNSFMTENELNSAERLNDNEYLISNIFKSKSKAKPFKSSSLNEKKSKKEAERPRRMSVSKSELLLSVHNGAERQPSVRMTEISETSRAKQPESRNDLNHSSPSLIIDFGNRSQSKFKRRTNVTRSLYGLEHRGVKGIKKPYGKIKMSQIPIYNTKQLNLIYKQYRQERLEKQGVPVSYTLVIMQVYLICGMLIFSSYEKWGKLDALYFCFVTLTTIGFGDMIPGSTLLNRKASKNGLYISALYIFVGLILIAMCINLVKTQIKRKIKYVARKIGLSNC